MSRNAGSTHNENKMSTVRIIDGHAAMRWEMAEARTVTFLPPEQGMLSRSSLELGCQRPRPNLNSNFPHILCAVGPTQ